MKLKKFVKRYLDPMTFVTIYDNVGLRDEIWENIFKGMACDIPWSYMDRKIRAKENKDDDFGTMDITKEENGKYYLYIELAEKEDKDA